MAEALLGSWNGSRSRTSCICGAYNEIPVQCIKLRECRCNYKHTEHTGLCRPHIEMNHATRNYPHTEQTVTLTITHSQPTYFNKSTAHTSICRRNVKCRPSLLLIVPSPTTRAKSITSIHNTHQMLNVETIILK